MYNLNLCFQDHTTNVKPELTAGKQERTAGNRLSGAVEAFSRRHVTPRDRSASRNSDDVPVRTLLLLS